MKSPEEYATEALRMILEVECFADRALLSVFRSYAEKNAMVREITATAVYDILRNKRLYASAVGSDVPEDLVSAWFRLHEFEDPIVHEQMEYAKQEGRATRISAPDWLDAFGEKEIGDEWEKVMASMNEPPRFFLRTNTLKTTPQQLQETLSSQGFSAELVSGATLEVASHAGVFSSSAFSEGMFEMQDYASQHVAPFLGVRQDMRVVDACAGAGGKTLHLAALMNNSGKILALDVSEKKLEDLMIRSRRAGVSCIEPRIISSTKIIKRQHDKADAVLIDAPCSGSGVFRRNPDAKWRLSHDDMQMFTQMQDDILRRYSKMAKPGGIMVYAVCSIFPSEGEQRVRQFLSDNPSEWELDSEQRFFPHLHGCDGFYMARLLRRHAPLQ